MSWGLGVRLGSRNLMGFGLGWLILRVTELLISWICIGSSGTPQAWTNKVVLNKIWVLWTADWDRTNWIRQNLPSVVQRSVFCEQNWNEAYRGKPVLEVCKMAWMYLGHLGLVFLNIFIWGMILNKIGILWTCVFVNCIWRIINSAIRTSQN